MSPALTRRAALAAVAGSALGLAAGAVPASSDAALIPLAGRVSALATRRAEMTGRVKELDLQVKAAHPKPPLPVTNGVFRAYYAEIRPTEERIGLTRLRKVRRRTAERLDRWAADLAAMEPATPAGLGAKASAVLAIDALYSDDEGAEALLLSVLRDTVRLGGGAHA